MRYLLNVIYLAIIAAVSPWFVYSAVRKGKYREGWAAKFWGHVRRCDGDEPRIWFHAVSVGEVNVLRPLVKRVAETHPEWRCLVSTTTKTGYELARRLFPELTVFYCPLDFSWAAAEAMRRIRPDVFALVELELWPNLIDQAKRCGARVVVINGRLSERSARGYGRIRWFVQRIMRNIDMLAAQNEEYAERFWRVGAPSSRIEVTGSLKFDGAQTDRNNEATRRLVNAAGLAPSDVVFLAGSTQAPEESIALNCFGQLRAEHPELRLIIVPRHPERFQEVAQLLDRSGHRWQRRSRLESDGADARARILLVDTIGELGAWWGTAQIGFVGGSMGSRGGQNMIEPAAYGVATSFGPNTRNFRDIVAMLLARDAAVVTADQNVLLEFVRRCLTDVQFRRELGERASRLVGEQLGATDRTLALLERLVGPPATVNRRAA